MAENSQAIHDMDSNANNPNGDMVPHDSNPESARDVAERAMKEAQEKAAADDAAVEEQQTEADKGDVIDWEAAKGAVSDAKPGEAEAETEDTIGDLEPLSTWTADQQDTFRQLDKDAQQYVLDVASTAINPLQSQLESLQPWQRVAETWTPYIQQNLNGAPVEKALESLFNADMILRTGSDQQKLNLLNKLIQDYRIPVGQPQAQAIIPEDLADDPVAQAMQGPLQTVMNQINELKAQLNTQSETYTNSQRQQAEATIAAFANAVGEDGKPLRPYFAEVEPLMTTLAQHAESRGQQATLEQLYEQAVRATPEVWAKVQSAEKAGEILARQKAAAGKKQAAKSVSSSPSGARSEQVQVKPQESAYDTVMAAMKAHGWEG